MINPPSEKTLKKYGLSAGEWLDILELQGGVCAVCKKAPKSGRYNIDHDHIRGWKDLPDEQRKLHIRGILCWHCNSVYVGRAITIAKSEAITAYLKAHEERVVQYVMRQR